MHLCMEEDNFNFIDYLQQGCQTLASGARFGPAKTPNWLTGRLLENANDGLNFGLWTVYVLTLPQSPKSCAEIFLSFPFTYHNRKTVQKLKRVGIVAHLHSDRGIGPGAWISKWVIGLILVIYSKCKQDSDSWAVFKTYSSMITVTKLY